MFEFDRSTPDSSVALTDTTEGSSSEPFPFNDSTIQPLPFEQTFEFGFSVAPPEIRDDLRQMMLEALHGHDLSRSGIDRSLMHDASVVSRNVSQEL